MPEHPVAFWVVLVLMNTPIFVLFGRLIFGSWWAVWSSIGYTLKPDWLSWADGEWADDQVAEMRLFAFLALCAALVLGEGWVLARVLPDDPEAEAATLAELVEAAPESIRFEMRRDGVTYGPWPITELARYRADGRVDDADEVRLVGDASWRSTEALAARLEE